MNKVVVYSSLTGNTKKVANAICETLKCDMYDYKDISLDELNKFNFVAIGFYIDKGEINDGFREFASKISNKKVGIFITMGGDTQSQYAKDTILKFKERFADQNNDVLVTFCCQGAIDPRLIEKMREMAKMFPDDARHMITPEKEARWARASVHPDKDDLKDAIRAFEPINNL